MQYLITAVIPFLLMATASLGVDSRESLSLPDTVSAAEALGHVGATKTVCGYVSGVDSDAVKGLTLVSYGRPRPRQFFTVVFADADLPKLSPILDSIDADPKTQRLCVTGPITSYNGKPEILTPVPSQVGIVSEAVTLAEIDTFRADLDALMAANRQIQDRNSALQQVMEPGSEPSSRLSPLLDAAVRGSASETLTLLMSNADPDQSFDGTTPLMEAAFRGHADVVRALILSGADVNLGGDGGGLAPASDESRELLAEHGITSLCENPLDCAVVTSRTPIVGVLLKRGADPSATGLHGWTPLLAAALTGQVELLEMLLEAGSNINAVGDRNRRQRSANSVKPGPIRKTSSFSTTDLAKDLQNLRSDLHSISEDALSLAGGLGDAQMVRSLLNAGATRLEAALQVGVFEGHIEVVRLLLNKGADPNSQTKYGRTPLMLAVVPIASEPRTPIIEVLLAYGADVGLKDNFGLSAVDLAVKYGTQETYRLVAHAAEVAAQASTARKLSESLRRTDPSSAAPLPELLKPVRRFTTIPADSLDQMQRAAVAAAFDITAAMVQNFRWGPDSGLDAGYFLTVWYADGDTLIHETMTMSPAGHVRSRQRKE